MAKQTRGRGRPHLPENSGGELETRLYRWAKQRGVLDRDLARRVGVTSSAVTGWFRRGRKIHPLRRGIIETFLREGVPA